MCSTIWEATVLPLDEDGEIDRWSSYGDDELLESLGLEEKSWSIGATYKAATKHYYSKEEARSLAIDHAARLLAYNPQLKGRVTARQVYYCSGTEIDEVVEDEIIEARAAEILRSAEQLMQEGSR